ncbi:MFS transporter [Niameybacter massiliensis]|uniref:MFS transporter n=1 Tax=Holtiella tumoricola TaxID=3018743 RepID=A0AA42J0T0_9FIRM|nr:MULTISPECIES: MFS transporter [Lachnospirales]MDA3731794.1 MFS transporter [Holtiella tumoricola]
MKTKQPTLWTRNFTIITLGTIISALGGVATSFAMNIVVFKETESTLLTGLYTVLILIPQLILPIIIGPYIDRFSRKKLIVSLDFLMGFFFLFCSFLTRDNFFSYPLFVVMGILINTNGVIYGSAYNALYPDLIPEGMYQKGYSVSSMIYPLASTLMTPVAALIFEHFGVSFLFVLEGVLLIVAASFECFIKVKETLTKPDSTSYKVYLEELKQGFCYIQGEKGLLAIFTYFFFTMFASQATALLLVPFFENHQFLTLTSYSLLISAETIGRTLSGTFHYLFKIPTKARFKVAASVYVLYDLLEGIMLFMAFPVMLIIRFLLGFMGTNSANIRMSSVQSYVPSEIRGRVNGFSSILSMAGVCCGSLVSGILGEYFNYAHLALVYGIIGTLAAYFLIIKNKDAVSAIYNREL